MLNVCETFNVHLTNIDKSVKCFLYGVTLNNVKLIMQLRIQLITIKFSREFMRNTANTDAATADTDAATADTDAATAITSPQPCGWYHQAGE